MARPLHPVLTRLLRKAGASHDAAPSAEVWEAVLALVSRTYVDADQDRYTLERSMDMSSREMQGLYEDLERRTRAELETQRQHLELSYAILQAALEGVNDAVVVVNGRGELIAINRRFFELMHVDPSTTASGHGATVRAALKNFPDPEAAGLRIAEIHASQATTREVIELTGGRFVDRYSAPIALPDGSQGGRVSILRDITAERIAHQRLEQQAVALSARNAQLQQLEQDKRRLTELVVHDLKGPAMAILCNAELLQQEQLPAALAETVDDILISIRHVEATVRDLLDLSRAEDVRVEAHPELVELRGLVDDVASSLRGLGRLHRVGVVASVTVPSLLADRELVRRLLQNLVQNAIRHAPPSTDVEIEFGSAPEGGVLLRVSDAGPGVAPELAERIFAPYVSGDRSPGGHGLGLVFCRLAAEAHGGRIWVEPNLPSGASFFVSLPQLV